ncbi:conjugative transposon protein TraM [Chryseobacterium sp. ISL-6]|uniref:conjugative transposon protein TraM n=1 Tax=Chryseobacterium sp. ISL-6 TaxID=2819143 RepID=UPI001BE77B77|nr:conjugative transposon protein TraM [Chryseobacterium sp. ISL-6]MBT2621894.1 conjugative transposon protein TraM [Chryseobacterium sp. ISL-6]
MKENDKNKASIRLTEVNQKQSFETESSSKDKFQKLKKPLIFGLMAIVFSACMYLIFEPSSEKKENEQAGLNEVVPQATEAGMQADKSKAYESELLEQKELEKKRSLSGLSDYWNVDSTNSGSNNSNSVSNPAVSAPNQQNEALKSYRNIQGTLGSFYEDRGQTTQLQNEVQSLRTQLAQKEAPQTNPVESQLALMEKSYQMAAKYFPAAKTTGGEKPDKIIEDTTPKNNAKVSLASFYPAHKSVVSALYREPSDSAWLADLQLVKNRKFYTVGNMQQNTQPANSIRACIHETQTITSENAVRIRLLDETRISKLVLPKGTILTAIAKFQGYRLQLQISSVEFEGNIIATDILAYDTDGQQGLAVPYSAERNALTDVVANMGNTGGTSISLSSTTGQQITSDLSKSVVQGISGYFSKKVRMPKITLKAGYQIFLIAKK